MDIQLTQGKVATIDDVDADLAALKWHAAKSRKNFYARRNIRKQDGGGTTEGLHQVIAKRIGLVGPPDHVDRDGLNNSRGNLRPANASQNAGNVGLVSTNTSGFRGVYLFKQTGRWRAQITIAGRFRSLGFYVDPVEAAKAYDRAALEAWGDFACLNFPVSQSCRGGL